MAFEDNFRLAPQQLRWTCDPAVFSFETTAELEIQDTVVGQETAKQALLFGIECLAHGQNVYVRGVRGTGRITMVRQLFREHRPTTDRKKDRCYVNNFSRPDRPRLITLPPGSAPEFRRRVQELSNFIQDSLRQALDSEPHLSRREAVKEKIQSDMRALSGPLEHELADNGLAMVTLNQGPMATTAIFPLVNGEPTPPDQLATLIAQGKAPQATLDSYETKLPEFQKELDRVGREISDYFRKAKTDIEGLKQSAARELLAPISTRVIQDFPFPEVKVFIEEVVSDAVENRLTPESEEVEMWPLYGVNIILQNDTTNLAPVVEEVVPSLLNLLGTVDIMYQADQTPISDYRGIRGGAILNADNGFLLLDVEDLVAEPGAYRALMRTLRTRKLEIVPPEAGWMRPYVVIQPEPIPIDLRVILVGDIETFYQLDHYDQDFRELFKVLADFEDQIPRDNEGTMQYAIVVARLAKEENLLPFHRTAIAALVEHGARVVARDNKLTARFGRIADIAREAAFLAKKDGRPVVIADDIRLVIKRTKQRASLPSRNFQDLVDNGTIMIQTSGSVVGQINGLAVIQSGPLTYGFPARITASIGPGTAGLINIEGTARMSGSIHTKGFHILGGLLRHLLQTNHPLSFSASLAFEQSYGGIDGDSASGAEMVCMLSALTGIAIRQDLAMTGAIDQHGHIQAIGGVNEKIEGFFDVCRHAELTGNQGVVIPKSNSGNLMLRADVVEAAKAGLFHVYAVDSIYQAIELFTGFPTTGSTENEYESNSVLGIAVRRAREFWEKTLAAPVRLTQTQVVAQSEQKPVNPIVANPPKT